MNINLDLPDTAEHIRVIRKIFLPVVTTDRSLSPTVFPELPSDLHLTVENKVVKLSYRTLGEIQYVTDLTLTSEAINAWLQSMAPGKWGSGTEWDTRGAVIFRGVRTEFRFCCLPVLGGRNIVFRFFRPLMAPEYHFHPKVQEIITRLLTDSHGLAVVSGPTGSGKSQLLYHLLQQMNSTEVNICTIEDPVEKTILGINQTNVNVHNGETFSAQLRKFLRMDPDIIMVGEIRDTDTAATALRAAMTGHLILSTVHTTDALSIAQRLVDMGTAACDVRENLQFVFAIRLVPNADRTKRIAIVSAYEQIKGTFVGVSLEEAAQYAVDQGLVAAADVAFLHTSFMGYTEKPKQTKLEKRLAKVSTNGLLTVLPMLKARFAEGVTAHQLVSVLAEEEILISEEELLYRLTH